ncbi:MAG: hypothetical protein KUL83_07970 [Lentimicrobium sp.]|jgi:hypothetical protein|nr:hypothetical protein [Lentimicrobium sp.]MDD2527548.1 hypothetical protein [Lentimicrobiaceae bacterium]MDY0025141.1 hypothetical protein [Lentimicrobium sp.]HAH59047.1 hypothetical protein [Bacteroidales bacterium]
MKKYFFRGLIFALPLFVYVLFILIVDPYNFINVFHVIPAKEKFRVIQRTDESSPRGNILWKTIEFKRNPVPNIIVGDSQGKDIDVVLVDSLTGEPYYNLCAPGSSFETMFNMFWFAARHSKLEKVYFQVAFMNYNANRQYDLFHFAADYFERPYEYFTTREIFFDAVANVAWAVSRNSYIVERSYEYLSPMNMENMARKRLDMFFGNYIYPDKYRDEFIKIKQYCSDNDIKLCFVILPVYKEVDQYLEEKGMIADRLRFRKDINSYGYTINLDKLTYLKEDRNNFIDYFHPTQSVIDALTRIIWSDEYRLESNP